MSNTDKGAALSDVLASAPRHGMNAKALLLQAAALAAQEAASLEGEAPLAISEREQQIAKLKAAFVASSKLLTGIPKRESPVVAYVNTAKVPRIVRQQVLQKLVGQHLAAALLDSGAECSAAEVAARHSTRKAAMAAATEQELQLFKSCLSKASYQNLAARTDASSVLFPPELPLAVKPNPPSPSPTPESVVQSAAGAANSASMPHKESNSHALATELDADTDQLPNKRQKIKTNEDTATAEEQLLDDDIDWHASSSYADVEAVSEAADDPTDAHHHSVPDVNDGMQATCHSPQDPGATAEAPGVMQSDVMKQDPDCKRIQHAVNEYIRAFLDPFYKAGIVNKEMYKLVMKKAVAKVMQSHCTDMDTDFLIQESDQVQKLVREYIRYAQKKVKN